MATTAPIASPAASSTDSDAQLIAYLNLKLREIGQPGVPAAAEAGGLAPLVDHFLALSREKDRALTRHLAPVDQRIQNFLYEQLDTHAEVPRLPAITLVLDRPVLSDADKAKLKQAMEDQAVRQ